MVAVLKPKKSETASAVPTTSDLAVGEICMNVADQKVYTRKSDNSIVIVASHGLTDLDGSVTTAKLADGAVTTIKLAADAVDGTKLADNACNSEHYTDGSIDLAHLAADSVDGTKIADNGINSEHYTDGSIDTAHIADDQVTYAKIQNVSATDRILGRDSASAGVIEEITPANLRTMLGVETGATADQSASEIKTLLEDGIDSVHYVNGSIDTAHIGDNQVTGAKIALGSDAAGDVMYYNGTNYIRLAKGTATQVLTMNSGATAPEWAADSTNVTGTSVGGDLSGTVGNAQIATNTVGITELNVSDGSTGQVLKTNGSGTLSFTDSGATLQQATAKAVTMAIALG